LSAPACSYGAVFACRRYLGTSKRRSAALTITFTGSGADARAGRAFGVLEGHSGRRPHQGVDTMKRRVQMSPCAISRQWLVPCWRLADALPTNSLFVGCIALAPGQPQWLWLNCVTYHVMWWTCCAFVVSFCVPSDPCMRVAVWWTWALVSNACERLVVPGVKSSAVALMWRSANCERGLMIVQR